MIIRKVQKEDAGEWLRTRTALWPESNADELAEEIDKYVSGKSDEEVFVAVRNSGGLCGFLEASIRKYANGCETSPVGYIEGWYVDPDVRRSGVGRMLVAAAEAWAAEQGCTEMASDCDIDNETSLKAHLGVGFEEKERVICFCKKITVGEKQ